MVLFMCLIITWSVDISSGLLDCRRCHLNCRANESRMQFFRCALLWETLKLSCWRECSMKDDPSHFSHDMELLQPAKRTNTKVYGKFYYLFCFNLPGKKCIFSTHIPIPNDAQRGDFTVEANQSQDMKYSDSGLRIKWVLLLSEWFFLIWQSRKSLRSDSCKFCSPHCSRYKFLNWSTRKVAGV